MSKRHATLLAAAALWLALTGAVTAQDYPNKPVRLIIPFPPGGSNDVVGRMIGTQLSERLGKQVVVDNRAGAGGVVGTELAASAPKDGYTILIISMAHAVNPWLYKLPYDPLKAFTPISILASGPNVVAVHPGLPVNSIKELVALAKQKPGELQYASAGVGSFQHLGGELFKLEAGVDMLHVPFKGGGPAMIDVIGGHTKLLFSSLVQTTPHIRSGKLKALGVGGSKRNAVLPEVPTVAESGVPSYEAVNWWGLVAPAGTPAPIIGRLNAEMAAASSCSVDRLDRDAEQVSGAALGPDIARLRRIALDLAAQAQDLHVDGAVVDLVVVQPRQVEELVAGQDPVRGAQQDHEQAELAVGKRHGAAVGGDKTARIEIELPAVEPVGADSLRLALANLGAPAPKHGANAREQLARAERLGEVVVGAELEAHHPVGFFAAAGEHDDGNLGFVAQAPCERHAVFAPELQIEHHQVHGLLAEDDLHRRAVGDGADPQLVLAEIVANQLANHRVIVHDEHVGQRSMRRSLWLRDHGCLEAHFGGSLASPRSNGLHL
jgi:tripartite-type tricarboxylate transporter receptor subunit TctC